MELDSDVVSKFDKHKTFKIDQRQYKKSCEILNVIFHK
jgi:hypothetical protein